MFQPTMNADTLRTLSKSLKRAADKVTGTPMPLSQANEILAQTLGRGSWRDALKQAATPVKAQTVPSSDFSEIPYLQMLRFMRLWAQLGGTHEWSRWDRFNEEMERIFYFCQEEYEHVEPVILQWQELSKFFEQNRSQSQDPWVQQAWTLLMQRFHPALSVNRPLLTPPQELALADVVRQAHPGYVMDMTSCTVDTTFLETRAERLCFIQELTQGLRKYARDLRDEDNEDNPIQSLDAMAETWIQRPMASGIRRTDLGQAMLDLSEEGNGFEDVRMAVLMHLAFQAGAHDPFLGLGLVMIAFLACETHGPLIDALSLLMTDGWV